VSGKKSVYSANIMHKNVFIVMSVIFFKHRRLSYHKFRSAFSPRERLEQTKKTIESIKKKMPSAEIYLFEQGLSDEISSELAPLVDEYVYTGNNFFVRFATDSIFKGLGEAVGLLYASKFLPKNTDRFFKISGRYFLNENFDLKNFEKSGFTVKRYGKAFSTRLYSFDGLMFYIWKRSLYLSLPLLLLNRSLETTMSLFVGKKNVVALDKIGVSGIGGAHGDISWNHQND